MKGRIEQVRHLIEREHLDGVIVSSQANLSWLFGGRFHINIATEAGAVSVLITGTRMECLVNNIEQERLLEEEGLNADAIRVYPWYDEAQQRKVMTEWTQNLRVKSDADLPHQFRRMRTSLDAEQVTLLRSIGRQTAVIVETACRNIHSRSREYDAAAEMAAGCYRAGLDPVVVLAAGERRAQLYRHPLPSEERIHAYGILALCARKHGLVVSVSRMVAFEPVADEIVNKHEAVIQVDAAMISATRPGTSLQSVLNAGLDAYRNVGFAEEWKQHHQGGLAGYQSRELRAMPDAEETVQLNQAFAWNPTIRGVKSEDTILVTERGNEVITHTGSYPLVDVKVMGQTVRRPGILRR